jgi:hypothetical protein
VKDDDDDDDSKEEEVETAEASFVIEVRIFDQRFLLNAL